MVLFFFSLVPLSHNIIPEEKKQRVYHSKAWSFDMPSIFGHVSRPAAARNAGGVFGPLIASTGNIAGVAAPHASTLQPNIKRPGYKLSRSVILFHSCHTADLSTWGIGTHWKQNLSQSHGQFSQEAPVHILLRHIGISLHLTMRRDPVRLSNHLSGDHSTNKAQKETCRASSEVMLVRSALVADRGTARQRVSQAPRHPLVVRINVRNGAKLRSL